MKVILSRKGFDSKNGGMPSPILPDGTLLSLPIPSPLDTEKFSRLKYCEKTYLEIIKELKPRTKIKDRILLPVEEVNELHRTMADYWNKFIKIRKVYGENHVKIDTAYDIYEKAYYRYEKVFQKFKKIYKEEGGDDCHLDPDLRRGIRPREKGWRPLFGQASRAQTILNKNEVSIDDLFLFFGWFRKVQKNREGKYVPMKDEPDLHVIYGYLQVGKIFSMDDYSPSDIPKWMQYHSHADKMISGSIYAARDKLSFAPKYHGGGMLQLPS